MELQKLTRPLPDMQVGLRRISAFLDTIGTDGFVQAAMALGHDLAEADFFSVFCLGDRETPLLIGTACRLGQRRAEQAAEGYRSHMNEDRNVEILGGSLGAGDFLTMQDAASIPAFPYRRDCYDRPGISSRVSLVRRTSSYGLSVSLYSSAEHGPFDEEARQRAASVLGVILVATERHVAFTLTGDVRQEQDLLTRLALGYPSLTQREREVTALTMKGGTAAQIATALGLSETTVITHRKKAYKRLNVASLRELLAKL